jgi:excisionase family DNA binding protein
MLVSAKVAAQQLGISESTLYALARSKRVPCVKFGRVVRFNLEKLVAACSVEADPANSDTKPLPIKGEGRRQSPGK